MKIFEKLKVKHSRTLIRAKFNNIMSEEIQELNKKLGLHSAIIDEKLYNEDIDVIKLFYDNHSKWLTLHNACALGIFAMTIAYWGTNTWLVVFLLLSLIRSVYRAYKNNIQMNIVFNTLVKKTKETKETKETENLI